MMTEGPPLRRLLVLALSLLAACSGSRAKNHYILAEQLWIQSEYKAAVSEFDKVTAKDPKGELGQQALFRSATTQMLFTKEYTEAIWKFRTYSETAKDTQQVWEAKKQIGEILFSYTQQYEDAIQHYQTLLKQAEKTAEEPEFLFRIARSYFFLKQFSDSIYYLEKLIRQYPKSDLAGRAAYEIGVSYFTQAEKAGQSSDFEGQKKANQQAQKTFEKFLETYADSPYAVQAEFWLAALLEESKQYDAAGQAYEKLLDRYPVQQVIRLKLHSLEERKNKRSR